MKLLRWLKHRIGHKLEHIKPSHLMNTIVEHGVVLVVIIVAWEIIEDILFPLLFIWLGKNVNPWFLTGAPISWLLCLHPIAVPILWALWIKISRRDDEKSVQD
jgi:Na+-transporting NADH:ubiquinone oxidoreductase subunit NqrB